VAPLVKAGVFEKALLWKLGDVETGKRTLLDKLKLVR
jgi:hypothetical protein